jgi:hypothetical protein
VSGPLRTEEDSKKIMKVTLPTTPCFLPPFRLINKMRCIWQLEKYNSAEEVSHSHHYFSLKPTLHSVKILILWVGVQNKNFYAD